MWSSRKKRKHKIEKLHTCWYHKPLFDKRDQSQVTAIHLNISLVAAHHLISYSLANVTKRNGYDSGRVSGEACDES